MQYRQPDNQPDGQNGHQALMDVPVCIATVTGPDHTFTYVNLRFSETFGPGPAAALLGRQVREVLPHLEASGVMTLLDEVYMTGHPVASNGVPLKTCRGGDHTGYECFFDLTLEPLRGAGSTVDGVIIQALEVTAQVRERQRTEALAQHLAAERQFVAELLDLQRRRDVLLNASPDLIFMVDPSGRFTYANRAVADMIGAPAAGGDARRQDLLGHTPREAGLPEEFITRFEVEYAKAVYGAPTPDGLMLPLADGLKTVSLVLRPVYREDGTVEALAGFARDVGGPTPQGLASAPAQAENTALQQAAQTEVAVERQRSAALTAAAEEQSTLLRQTEERVAELEDLSHQKDEFIAVASHELKSPLTTIRGYAQLALRRVRGPEPDLRRIEDSLIIIHDEIISMTWLLDDLLDASRIQMGTLELRTAPCDIGECLTAVLARLSPGQRARVGVMVFDAPLTGIWERKKIEQVLANLVSNALKYSPGGEGVNVTMAQRDGNVHIAVRDLGLGIPADELPRLFQRFYRTPQAKASGVAGTGLGLYICRGIVEAHGGRLWAESPGSGRGATFRVVLPERSSEHGSPVP